MTLFLLGKTKDFLQSTYFRVLICVSAVTIAGYVAAAVILHSKHKRSKSVFKKPKR